MFFFLQIILTGLFKNKGEILPLQSDYKKFPIMLGLLIGGFIGMFSETALNIALTSLMKDLHITASTVQWLTTGYLLVVGVLVPVSGLMIRWFTTRQLLLSALSAFIIGTLISAVSHTFPFLLIGRLVQGIATGILIPLIFNTVMTIFPPHKRGAALGVVGLVIMFAPAIGPTAAGFILGKLTWQWIFWVMLPFLVAALIISAIFCKNVNEVTRPKIDVLSIVLSTIGFGGIVFGFSSAGDSGWGNAKVIVTLAIGVAALTIFSIRQLRMEKPMLNVRVFQHKMFTIGTLMIMIDFSIIMSSMLLLPMYWQSGKLVAVALTGILLLPGGIVNGIVSAISGKLYDIHGAKWLVRIGFLICIVAGAMFICVQTTSSFLFVIAANLLLMIGAPLVMSPAQTNGLNALPREMSPDGSAIMNTAQQVSGAIATALSATLLAAGEHAYTGAGGQHAAAALTNGVQYGFMFTLILAVIGFALSFTVRTVGVFEKPQDQQRKMQLKKETDSPD